MGAEKMSKPGDKRPSTLERLSGRFSIHGAWGDSLGGLPDNTNADFAALVGMVPDKLQQIILGAGPGQWPQERDQLREIILRRSWGMWQERKRDGNLNGPLNEKITDQVMVLWEMTDNERQGFSETRRARWLGIDPRRFKSQIKQHELDLVAWLDIVTGEAAASARRILRK